MKQEAFASSMSHGGGKRRDVIGAPGLLVVYTFPALDIVPEVAGMELDHWASRLLRNASGWH